MNVVHMYSAHCIGTTQYMPVIHTCMYVCMCINCTYVRIMHSVCNGVYVRIIYCVVIKIYVDMYVRTCCTYKCTVRMYVHTYVHAVHRRHSLNGDN